MQNIHFVFGLALFCAVLLTFGLRYLPREQWQILAAVPSRKSPGGAWQGTNYTYYGFFLSTALVLATLLFFILMGSAGIDPTESATLAAMLLGICLPAAKVMARIVEKRKHTLTVGGASFIGILAAPFLTLMANTLLSMNIPLLIMLSALTIAFVLGEGLGRLACVSFGCCYGRRLDTCHPLLKKFMAPAAIVFQGATKKVAYEGKLEGVPLVPVQAMTSLLNCILAVAGTWLFMIGQFAPALCLCLAVSQIWRVLSEMLRADYRGGGRFSAYQHMSILCFTAALGLPWFLPTVSPTINIIHGITALWSPVWILFFQLLWVFVFVYAGRSMVTGSDLYMYVKLKHHEEPQHA